MLHVEVICMHGTEVPHHMLRDDKRNQQISDLLGRIF